LCSRDGAAAEQTASASEREHVGTPATSASVIKWRRFAKAVEKDFGSDRRPGQQCRVHQGHLLFLMTEADWDSVVDTNLKGTFLMTKYAARA